MKKILTVGLVLGIIALLATGCVEKKLEPVQQEKPKEVKTFKLGGINPPETPMTMAQFKFAELVKQKSNGSMVIDVFPASQLGTANSQIEQTISGGIDMFGAAVNFYAQYAQDWNVLNVPFLYNDKEHVQKFMESKSYQELKQQLIDKAGMREIVGALIRPPEELEATKPINTMADFKGLMMRVPEIEMYQLFAKEIGSKTVTVAWGEVYMALKQGVAEALIPPLDGIYSSKLHQVAPYILMTDQNYARATIVMNEKKYQSLTSEEKKIIDEAARETEKYFNAMVDKSAANDVEKMKAEGAKIVQLTDKDAWISKFTDFALRMESQGKWRKGLFEEIRALDK